MVEEVEAEIGPTAFALEADGRLAAPMIGLKRRMQQASASAGLYCPHLPAPDGLGLGLVDTFYIQEEVYRHGLRGVQWMLAWTDGPSHLVRHWSPESRERHLADFLAGRTSVAFALTEPGAGSDALALETSARRDGDGWVLNGVKHLITGAPFVEHAQVIARVEGAERRQLTAFLVPMDAPGAARGPVQQTIMADGQTGVLEFTDVRLPPSALMGEEGGGPRARLPLDQLGAQPPRRDVLGPRRALPRPVRALHRRAPGLRAADRRLRRGGRAPERRLHGLAGDAGALAGDPGAPRRRRAAGRRSRGRRPSGGTSRR